MSERCDLMVFTDLDGTLIDHDTYGFSAASEALEALKKRAAALILASSKTAAEMIKLRAEIGVENWPAIVENGAGILPPFADQTPDATQYERIRAILQDLPDPLRLLFRGFGDMSAEEVAQETGLSLQGAVLAKSRCFSEPGQWLGDAAQKQSFLLALKEQGVTALQGGRFLTLSFGSDKVDQMRKLIDTYEPRHTIALGDAPNDIAMLEAAEFAVIVHNPSREPLPTLKTEMGARVIRTVDPGPLGWNGAMLDLLTRLDLE